MKKLSFVCLLATLSFYTTADELKIGVSQQAEENQQITRPVNGMSMDDVHAKYGEPKDIFDPVGEPPITKWVYPLFTVYYENNLVIHTVLNPSKDVKTLNE